jgi:hypothetical protein
MPLWKAILAGTIPASSLNVVNPTRTDLAEQMPWAAGDAEIVRLCLSQITRPRDDSWWNDILIYAGEPEKLKLILDHGVDPDLVGDGGFTTPPPRDELQGPDASRHARNHPAR